MKRALPPTHSPTCSGCPHCNEEMAASLRSLSRSGHGSDYFHQPPPDGYASGLAARHLRTGDVDLVTAPELEDDAKYQPFGTPPDGYALALRARRELENQ